MFGHCVEPVKKLTLLGFETHLNANAASLCLSPFLFPFAVSSYFDVRSTLNMMIEMDLARVGSWVLCTWVQESITGIFFPYLTTIHSVLFFLLQ